MFRNTVKKLLGKQEEVTLIDIDELYKETIVHLSLEARVHYCNNLIQTCILDVNNAKIQSEKDKIYTLMNAAKREIDHMNE
ncbi:MAG: hypothetical protein HWE22_06015 [Flavobacteriales bacterium]|nr:hypothetical protein [Flavobacteriales bacterium]